jgi:hypothetical protein
VIRTRTFYVVLLVAALLVAGVLSYYASTSPDGLMHVADTTGIATSEKAHASDGSPLAGYAVSGVGDGRLGKGLAGVIGVLVCLTLGLGLSWFVRRRPAADARDDA